MKALKSALAKRVLADPSARSQLRDANSGGSWIVRDAAGRTSPTTSRTIVVHDRTTGQAIRVTPTVVPKAA